MGPTTRRQNNGPGMESFDCYNVRMALPVAFPHFKGTERFEIKIRETENEER